MSEESKGKAPTHNVYTVIDIEGYDKSRWIELGAAWPTKDEDGFVVELDALPTKGRLVIKRRKQESQ